MRKTRLDDVKIAPGRGELSIAANDRESIWELAEWLKMLMQSETKTVKMEIVPMQQRMM